MNSRYLFYFCDSIGSVFDSQVLELLKSIKDRNIFKKVNLILGIRDNVENLKIRKRISAKEIELTLFKSYPHYPQFNFLKSKELKRVLRFNNVKPENSLFHTRGELIPYYLCKIFNEKHHRHILPDIRGVNVEEIIEFSNFNYFQKKLKTINYERALKNLNRFHYTSVVSLRLAKYLIEKHYLNPEKIQVVPCLAGKKFFYDKVQRNRTREILNLSDKDNLIVFSSAGDALWQNISVLTGLADRGMRILNLSKKEIQHKNIINKFVDYNSVPAYLNASDAAIIWRDKSIVNEVASPVKFSEFICCGLPLISNNSVTMITNYLKSSSYGYLLNNFDELDSEKVHKLRSMNRKDISDRAIKWLGIDNITDNYLRIYNSLH